MNIPSISFLSLNDAGFISTDGVFANIDELNVRLNDAGQIKLDLGEATKISIQSNDSGFVIISGKTNELEIQSNDSGDVEASKLESKKCSVQSNDEGQVNVFVTESLQGVINDKGVICYKGMPAILQVDIRDDGELRNCN